MSSLSIVLRYDRINKNNEAPINFFLVKNRKLVKVATGILVKQDFWDKNKCRVKRGHPNANRINAYLSTKYGELQDEVLKHETSTKSLAAKKLKEKVFGHEPTNIFQFADQFIQKYLEKGSVSTYDRCKTVIKKLEKYIGNRKLCLQDIDADFLSKYEKYLRVKQKNCTNTIHANYKFLRTLYNEAYRKGLIDHSDIPFNKYVLSLEKTQRTFLTNTELAALEGLKLRQESNLALHRDMFVFAAYSGGIRISDMLLMKWKQFDGTHIHITIKKTGSQLSLKLPQRALDILFTYQPDKNKPDQFIFPVLPSDLDLSDPVAVDTAISRGTALVNKSLNAITEKAKINKHISFHISRHTWATQALRKGISIDKVSRLMGHANIRETQIYAKIVSEELDKAMDAFND